MLLVLSSCRTGQERTNRWLPTLEQRDRGLHGSDTQGDLETAQEPSTTSDSPTTTPASPSPEDCANEPDGWSWELTGYGTAANESTLRAVAEALELDSAPEPDEPRAQLAAEAVPPGFEMTWQPQGAPVAASPAETIWRVTLDDSADAPATYCELEFR